MAEYFFDVTDENGAVIELRLTDNLVFPDQWKTMNPPTSLVVEAGGVNDDSDDRLICMNTGEKVMTLLGASWNSKVEDQGTAECDLCDFQCSPKQTWVLKEIS